MKSETCEFYITNWEGPPQTLVGKLFLENGKLRVWAKKGYENFMNETRNQKIMAQGRWFDPAKNPEGWFRGLPYQYSGTMVRAQIVKTSGKKKKSLAREGGSGSGPKGMKGRKDR